MFSTILVDVKFALRQLRKTPAFTLSVVLTLALGIGATTAIFSLVHAVLLAPLPFPHPEELMALKSMVQENSHSPAIVANSSSYPNFLDWRARSRAFASIATFSDEKFSLLKPDGSAEQVDGGVLSANAFRTLGVAPILGRDFVAADEVKGNHNVLLSYALWQRDFAGARDVPGKTLRLNNETWNIIGVMPRGLAFPLSYTEAPFWVTFGHSDDGPNSIVQQRGWNDVETVVGRLRAGATQQQALAEMTAIQQNLARTHIEDKLTTGVRLRPGTEEWVGEQGRPLRLLFAAVCCLLLIACANVAGMLLTRAQVRSGELAVRMALGATRLRVMQQLLAEFAALAVAGSVLGAILAAAALRLSLHALPDVPRIGQASVGGAVLLFAFALAVVTTLIFGGLPAWRAAQADPATLLQGGLQRNTPGRRQNHLHATLVVTETALTLLLLVGSGLLLRSFDRLMHSELGFRADHLLTFRAFTPPSDTPQKTIQFNNELLARLRDVPGVEAAGGSFGMPFSGGNMHISFLIDGKPSPPGEEPSARLSLADTQYLRTMGIPLIRGRWFSGEDDRLDGTPVTVINQAFARQFFPGEDPLGKVITNGIGNPLAPPDAPHPHRRIIGIIGDTRRLNRAEPIQAEYFLPFAQAPIGPFTFAMRTQGDPSSLIETARRLVGELAPGVPLYRVRTMEEAIRRTNRDQRFQAALMTGFSAISLLLAAVGTYGLLSYLVAQRTTEFGVRLALGAQPADVLRLVLSRGVRLALTGIALGAMVAYMFSARMASVLYQTAPSDPLVYGGTAVMLLAVAALASWLPARRAARLEPVEVLRRQ